MSVLCAASDLDVARGITTPIALAALCLLLGAGILRVALKGKANQNARMTIQYGFILAVVLSVLANVSYLVLASFQREVRISGTVRDAAGAPLDRVVIDIPGGGRGITDDHGNFQFIIPDVWTSDGYEAVATLRGYRTERIKLSGKRPKPLDVTLQPQDLTADALIGVHGDVLVRHSLGMPVLEIPLTFTDPSGKDLTINNISVELTGPDHRDLKLFPQMVRPVPNGPPWPPLPVVAVTPNQPSSFIWGFTTQQDYSLVLLAQRANKEYVLPLTEQILPDPDRTVYTPDLVSDLQSFMNSHFAWAAGEWMASIGCTVDGRQVIRRFRFNLSDSDIQRMKAIGKFYGSGIGVLAPWMYWQSEIANPTTIVTLAPAG